jgi:hypothetical protein
LKYSFFFWKVPSSSQRSIENVDSNNVKIKIKIMLRVVIVIIIIHILSLLNCNTIFLQNPHFHFAEPRSSVVHHLGNTGLETSEFKDVVAYLKQSGLAQQPFAASASHAGTADEHVRLLRCRISRHRQYSNKTPGRRENGSQPT